MNDHVTAIAELVTKLLNHFATADEPFAVRKAIARDWVTDLKEFTVHQVEHAATEWRRAQSFRPTIADIRRLATQAQQRDAERTAITDQQSGQLDEDTLKLYAGAEYHGDFRTPLQRRQAAIDAQEEKYRRGQAWRDGRLDAYDAIHWPEKLRERQRQAARSASAHSASQPFSPIGQVMAEMGVTVTEAEPVSQEAAQ